MPLRGEPLDLSQTLGCGQAFRWRSIGDEGWEGVAGGHAWRLRIDGGELRSRVAPAMTATAVREYLSRYFALSLSAAAVRRLIAQSHPSAARAVDQFWGLRILRQDPLETILTFTIATATNVPRVTRSIAALSQRHGDPIAVVDGVEYRDFPTLDAILAAPSDDLFHACDLAYRARSIKAVAGSIHGRPPSWASDLAKAAYPDAHRALDELPFLGPKVSDCICLFGLGHDDAVPVDVHVWAIAHELFGEAIPTRTLTAKTYRQIGDRFRALFSPWAGWAQQYLFSARRALPINQRFRPNGNTVPRS
ncbi:MAG: DNA glycosylase [Chloroflexota bacterium]